MNARLRLVVDSIEDRPHSHKHGQKHQRTLPLFPHNGCDDGYHERQDYSSHEEFSQTCADIEGTLHALLIGHIFHVKHSSRSYRHESHLHEAHSTLHHAVIRPVSRSHQHEAEYECESVRYLIGEVESVPYKVELVHVAAHDDEREHHADRYLLTYLYAQREDEYSEEQYSEHSARNIRQSLDLYRLFEREQVSDDLVPFLVVERILRERVLRTVRQFQSEVSRQSHERRKAYSQYRRPHHYVELHEEVLYALWFDDACRHEHEYAEYTGEVADIITRYERKCQREREHLPLPLTAYSHDAEHYQREKCYRIEPHHVPVISESVARKCEHRREQAHRKVCPLESISQETTAKSSAESYLCYEYHSKCITHIFVAEEYSQPVERTCRIVRYQRKEIRSHSVFPRVQERAARHELLPHHTEERIILMPQVNDEHLVLSVDIRSARIICSERVYVVLCKCVYHYQHRSEERYHKA